MLQPTDSPTKASPQEEEVKIVTTTEEPKMVTEPINKPVNPSADPVIADVRRNSLSGLGEI